METPPLSRSFTLRSTAYSIIRLFSLPLAPQTQHAFGPLKPCPLTHWPHETSFSTLYTLGITHHSPRVPRIAPAGNNTPLALIVVVLGPIPRPGAVAFSPLSLHGVVAPLFSTPPGTITVSLIGTVATFTPSGTISFFPSSP